MSTPEGFKDLYCNVVWKSDNEKRAFYNKYFHRSNFVREELEPLEREIEKLESKVVELKKQIEAKK